MKINSKGNTILIVGISVASVLILSGIGYYFYSKNEERKANIAKIEKLDRDLVKMLKKENYASLLDGKVKPANRSEIEGNLDKIKKNIKEYKETLSKLESGTFDETVCQTNRESFATIKFTDGISKRFLESSYEAGDESRKRWWDNAESDLKQNLREFERSACSDLYRRLGIQMYEE